jgi:hypothetical protein
VPLASLTAVTDGHTLRARCSGRRSGGFPSRLELLSAVARRGFASLAAQLGEAAAASTGSARAKLAALGQAYLDFARSDRGMYELMFRHDLLESNRLGLRDVSLPLFRMVTTLVAGAHPPTGAAPRWWPERCGRTCTASPSCGDGAASS